MTKRMNKRNIVWLGAIVVVGVAAVIAFGFVWGLVAAAATLVVSEIVERSARRRRRGRAGGAQGASIGDATVNRRRSR